MAKLRVRFSKNVESDLRKHVRRDSVDEVVERLNQLGKSFRPGTPRIQPLKGYDRGLYRVRLSVRGVSYRAIVQLVPEKQELWVWVVGPRSEVYSILKRRVR